MPKVRFLLTNTRTGEREQEVVGEVRLEGGRLVASNPDVERFLRAPLVLPGPTEDEPLVEVHSEKEPERFLENLALAYSGSYLRVTKVTE